MQKGAAGDIFGTRLCPTCSAPSPVADGEALWPADWSCPACGHAPSKRNGFVQLAPALDEQDEGFDLHNFHLLPDFEEGHFWFESRNVMVAWLVSRFAPDARRALEIGTGTGFVLKAIRHELPGAFITGSELHSDGLATARKRHGGAVELIQMDARRSGLRNALDLVGAFDVLEHIPEDEAVLAEIATMLRPGGVLVATVPQHPWMWSVTDDLAHHQRRYRIGELARKARAAGLTPVYQSSFTTLSFPLMVASRLWRRDGEPTSLDEQVAAEFDISPGVNRALRLLQRGEEALRRARIPMPFGGSQVVVARAA